jgi:phosphate-selective porin
VIDVTRGVEAVVVVLMSTLLAGTATRAQPAAEGAPAKAPGAFTWTPTAFVQFDVRGFPRWSLDPDDTRLRRDTFEVRRVRAGVDGTWKDLRFELSVDPVEWNEPPIQDAWIEWRPSRTLRLRGGQFKLPGGREYGTSSRRLGFLERSPLSESLAAGRDTGTQADLRIGRGWHAEVGVFLGDGRGREHRGGTTVASRVQ